MAKWQTESSNGLNLVTPGQVQPEPRGSPSPFSPQTPAPSLNRDAYIPWRSAASRLLLRFYRGYVSYCAPFTLLDRDVLLPSQNNRIYMPHASISAPRVVSAEYIFR